MLEGLHPNRPTHVFRITTDERSARAMTDLIGEIFDPAETAVAAFETVEDGPWLLEAYFAHEPNETAIRDLVRPIVGEEADKGVFLPLEQKDWVKASLEGLRPVRAGRVLVHGSHDREHRRTNDIAIEIEAGLAFGTGHHGTTLSCLQAFVDELKIRTPRHVLDVGTGTGILAFAAAKVLKRPVVAGDIDPEAVRVAKENARLNGIGPWMRLYVGPGTRNAEADRPGHFDLVFANILAKPLRILAPSLARVASNDGTLILSGLLGHDVPGVLSAYAHQGWYLQRRYNLEGWAALVLKRGSARPQPRR
ncbi:50S ribosomal protein L11 methyltransferase [Microvirga guangxiensis]|uniref:Ribosomal protein L11 methyltransferase n=1 Tax=Microvirga guangxiensis TaxID=549386 RepID=A0A1G5I1R6_9HYPH|nr:50S ribosomal protein L11 methyltransferase [Microvirga guangxiensis]SCY69500.1 ribosomal protein L11 methyltransferase [Microvirga guangxiensis]